MSAPVLTSENLISAWWILSDSIDDTTRRTYAGMVSAMDAGLANVTAALRARNMWGNTVFVLSNDNGGWNGYGGVNHPYRGHKTTLWDGGLRGLGLVVAPGRLPAGGRYGNLMHVTDMLPTLAAAAGATSLTGLRGGFEGIDGVSHWAGMVGANGTAPRSEILFNIDGVNGTGQAVSAAAAPPRRLISVWWHCWS